MRGVKILWLTREVKYEKHEMQVVKDYLKERGWEFTDDLEEADIIFFGADSMLEPKYLDRKDKFKILYWWGWDTFRLCQDPIYRRTAIAKMEWVKQCDMILSCSFVSMEQIAALGGVETPIVRYGIDDKTIESILDVDPKERKYQVCTIAILHPKKNLFGTIRMLSYFTKPPKFMLISCGGTIKPEELIGFGKKLGVEVEVTNLRTVDKIRELKSSLCYISSSDCEGFDIPIGEAMLAGVPTLVSDIPVHREIYKEFSTYFVDEMDAASKLKTMMYASNLKDYVEYARNYVRDELALSKLITEFERYLGEAVKVVLRKRLDANLNDKEAYSRVYDVDHELDYKLKSYAYDPSWSRHWRVQYVNKELKGETVLDLGCSMGAYAINFARQGFKVTGVDCSETALQQCQRNIDRYLKNPKHPIELKRAFADELPFESNSFDVLYAGELLEHLPDHLLKPSIDEMLRVVKTGGRIIITTPCGTHHNDLLHLRNYDENGFRERILPLFGDVNVLKFETIAESEYHEPSCIFVVLEKKEVKDDENL